MGVASIRIDEKREFIPLNGSMTKHNFAAPKNDQIFVHFAPCKMWNFQQQQKPIEYFTKTIFTFIHNFELSVKQTAKFVCSNHNEI